MDSITQQNEVKTLCQKASLMSLIMCLIHASMLHIGADQTCHKLRIGWYGESEFLTQKPACIVRNFHTILRQSQSSTPAMTRCLTNATQSTDWCEIMMQPHRVNNNQKLNEDYRAEDRKLPPLPHNKIKPDQEVHYHDD